MNSMYYVSKLLQKDRRRETPPHAYQVLWEEQKGPLGRGLQGWKVGVVNEGLPPIQKNHASNI